MVDLEEAKIAKCLKSKKQIIHKRIKFINE